MSISTRPSDQAAAGQLPHWDMSGVFPGLASPEFDAGFADVIARLSALETLFDTEGIDGRAAAALDDQTVRVFECALAQYNAMLETMETVSSYIFAFVSTDSRNNLAQAKLSEFQLQEVRIEKLGTRLTAWLGSLDVEALIERSAAAAEHAYPLRLARQAAEHQMSPAEEALAAELNPAAGSAWEKLRDNLSSQIMVRLIIDGDERELPMSEVRNLALHADRDLRRRAYEAELAAWADHALPIAAALNGIKGQVNTLSARRRWADPLDEALFGAHIDRETLDAMIAAARAAFPDLRRYLRIKARALNIPAVTWYDLFAPVGQASREWQWGDAVAFLLAQFGSYSDRMRGLAERAINERWIDAEPRAGKQGGAFCMSLGSGESRILANYTPAYDAVSTLAHELGHAYHNLNESGLTYYQRDTPMTLAETASTFCETIVREAALANSDPEEQLYILEQSLQGHCQIVVDIISRFDFERRVFAARQERELSIDELNAFMLDAQRGTYGDALDPATLHPAMWAVKGHYYSTHQSYYNFPYLFGLLFGLGLYARYREDADAFRTGYDDLLAWTGRADAAELGARFGIDVRSADFWRSSLDVIRDDIARFEQLIDAEAASAARSGGLRSS